MTNQKPQEVPPVRPLWKSLVMFAVIILAVPLTVVLGGVLNRSAYLLVGVAIIGLSMVPFFISFERRRPQARELVTLAVMIALSVAARVVFAFVPQFKPMAALVMVTGIAFGAPSGFLAGALSAFVSNFIFGQGPWTPWQMLAFGLCGFVFGLLADHGIIPRDGWSAKGRLGIGLGGGLFILCVAGPILDTSSLMWMIGVITPQSVAAVYLAGAPMNAVHGVATFVTLVVVGNAMLGKLSRLKVKYGILHVPKGHT